MDPRRLCLFLVFRVGDSKEYIRKVCGNSVFERTGPIWGLDPEGEVNGVWRDLGVKGLWSVMGKFSFPLSSSSASLKFAGGGLMTCRFHSKHVALRMWLFFPASCLVYEIFADLHRNQSDGRGSVRGEVQSC